MNEYNSDINNVSNIWNEIRQYKYGIIGVWDTTDEYYIYVDDKNLINAIPKQINGYKIIVKFIDNAINPYN